MKKLFGDCATENLTVQIRNRNLSVQKILAVMSKMLLKLSEN